MGPQAVTTKEKLVLSWPVWLNDVFPSSREAKPAGKHNWVRVFVSARVCVCVCVCCCMYVSVTLRSFQCMPVNASETACERWLFPNKRNFFRPNVFTHAKKTHVSLASAQIHSFWGQISSIHYANAHHHTQLPPKESRRDGVMIWWVSRRQCVCVCWLLNRAWARLEADYQPSHLCGGEGGGRGERFFYFSMRGRIWIDWLLKLPLRQELWEAWGGKPITGRQRRLSK